MVEGKDKFALWITPEAKREVENHFEKDNCKSKSEYIEKAIRFYSGYLDTQNASEYLPRVLADVLDGKLGVFGTRIGRQLFKLTVDQCLMGQELAAGMEIDPDQLQKARVRCIKMVKETNGEIGFDDMVAIQQGAQR